jgi:hypothetical protein
MGYSEDMYWLLRRDDGLRGKIAEEALDVML